MPNHKPNRITLFKLAAAPVALLISNNASAAPFAEIVYPTGTPQANALEPFSTKPISRKVDCGALYRPASNPKEMHFTQEILIQIDIEGATNIGKKIDLSGPEANVKYALGQNLRDWLQHYYVAHGGLCGKKYVEIASNFGKKALPYDAKPGWQNLTYCPLVSVAKQCAEAPEVK